jgi:menaquinone-dependent protoporphyrinogen oxidase
MMNILVGYASAHGSTAEIAQFMGRVLQAYGAQVTVLPVGEIHDVNQYDAVVLGSAIHGNMWLQSLSQFLELFESALRERPTYLFITCIRVMELGGREHALQEYVYHPTLEKVGIPVEKIGVFAGKIEINAISWDERWLLASNYDGTAGSKLVNHDYRDWAAIGTWALGIARDLQLSPDFS